MKNIVPQNITQCQFDFDSLAILPIPDNAKIGLIITPLPEPAQEQEQWWSKLEYQDIPRKPGIYAIININNGHFYIGSAVNLSNRKSLHFKDLRKGKHHSQYIQSAYNRYGASAFRFAIIERVSNIELLIEREQHYIDSLHPEYNISPTAGSKLGVKHTEEARKNMSEAQMGKKLSPASIEKREATRKARREAGEYAPVVRSEAQRAKQSETMKGRPAPNKGKPCSEATKRKISEANKGKPSPNKGKHASETQKAKQSEAMKGRTYLKGYKHTEEARKKMSEGQKRRKRTEKENAKISEALKGKKKSPETIAKRTATRKANREADPTYGTKKGETKQ